MYIYSCILSSALRVCPSSVRAVRVRRTVGRPIPFDPDQADLPARGGGGHKSLGRLLGPPPQLR